jgi:DNA-directed RNA polymerase alpha subunit
MNLESLHLDGRFYNLLAKHGYRTTADLCKASERDLLKIGGLGRLGLNNIKDALERAGLSLRKEEPTS